MSNSPSSDVPEQASAEKSFDVLFTIYTGLYDRFLRFALQNGAFMALGLGWLISSSDAQDFIRDGGCLRLSGVILGTLFYTAAHAYWCSRYGFRSNDCFRHISDLGYVRDAYLDPYRITQKQWLTVAGFHVGLAVYLIFLLASVQTLPSHTHEEPSVDTRGNSGILIQVLNTGRLSDAVIHNPS